MTGRGASGDMPDLLPPMQVSAGTGQPPVGPDWAVELAWTGHRCLAYVQPGRTRLLSANAVSMTAAYPELAAPLERRAPARGMIVDGTVVARGEEHAPTARRLARRSGRHRPTDADIRAVPVDFQVADLLWLDGHPTTELPYRDRRALLEGLGFDAAPVWTTSPLPLSELDTMLRIADAKGVEALHARHLGGRYRPGGRSPLWIKVPVPRVREVVVGGWTPADRARPDAIASLLLGVPDGHGGLRYVGRVGLTVAHQRELAGLPRLRATSSPFTDEVPEEVARAAAWVTPRVVGLVEFTGFTAGARLRLPHWQGLVDARPDLDGPPEPGRWAMPEQPPQRVTPAGSRAEVAARSAVEPTVGSPQPTAQPPVPPRSAAPQPAGQPATSAEQGRPPAPVEAEPVDAEPGPEAPPLPATDRRLEQHFVYNALNTIGSLIRTDPIRARDLLFQFADLSRVADQPAGSQIPLGRELAAVRAYLQLEQARFGKRLQVQWETESEIDALERRLVVPLAVLGAVRDAVQRDIEPSPQGGVLTISAAVREEGGELRIVGGAGEPRVIGLP